MNTLEGKDADSQLSMSEDIGNDVQVHVLCSHRYLHGEMYATAA